MCILFCLSVCLTLLSVEVFGFCSSLLFFWSSNNRGHERKPWQHFLSVCTNDTLVLCSERHWIFRISQQNAECNRISLKVFFFFFGWLWLRVDQHGSQRALWKPVEKGIRGDQGLWNLSSTNTCLLIRSTCYLCSSWHLKHNFLLKTVAGRRERKQQWLWCWTMFVSFVCMVTNVKDIRYCWCLYGYVCMSASLSNIKLRFGPGNPTKCETTLVKNIVFSIRSLTILKYLKPFNTNLHW